MYQQNLLIQLQIVISSEIKHAPNVFIFTEQSVAMLSSILRSKRAIRVNIEIMRAFVKLKRTIASHQQDKGDKGTQYLFPKLSIVSL